MEQLTEKVDEETLRRHKAEYEVVKKMYSDGIDIETVLKSVSGLAMRGNLFAKALVDRLILAKRDLQ